VSQHNTERPKPPRDFWREVPCGHPPDPIAWVGDDCLPICHCGSFLGGSPLPSDCVDLPPEIEFVIPCGKCGCAVGIPRKAPESESLGRDMEPLAGRPGYNAKPTDWVRYANHLEQAIENMVPASFAGLVQILDTHYPSDVFGLGAPLGDGIGARLVTLARELAKLRKAADEVIANAQRERHGLSSVTDAVLDALAEVSTGSTAAAKGADSDA
jgi:hypothetical protein